MKKIIAMILSLLIFTQLTGCGISKDEAYAHYEAGEYLEAAEIFAELGDKKMQAESLYEAGEYLEAAEIFAELGEKKMQAESLYEAGHYREAEELFSEINDYSGSCKCISAMLRALNKIVPMN